MVNEIILHSGTFVDREDNVFRVTFFKGTQVTSKAIHVSPESMLFTGDSGYADISVWSTDGQVSLKLQSGTFLAVSPTRFPETDIEGSIYKQRNYRVSVGEYTTSGTRVRQGVLRAYFDDDEGEYIDVVVSQNPKVTQPDPNPEPTPVIYASPSVIYATGAGGTYYVEVWSDAGTPFISDPYVDWWNYYYQGEVDGKRKYAIGVMANNDGPSRSTEIKVRLDEVAGVSTTITLNQAPTPVVEPEEPEPTPTTSGWVAKTWGGTPAGNGADVWEDNNGNIFYTNYNISRQLIGDTWYDVDFGSFRTQGHDIWKDNEGNIYYCGNPGNGRVHYQYLGGAWTYKTGFDSIQNGDHVWKDKYDNIYYNYGGTSMKLVNGVWMEYNHVFDYTYSTINEIYGNCIWDDGSNIFHTNYERGLYQNFILNDGVFIYLGNIGLGNINESGKYIWHDNDNNTYFSYNGVNKQFINGEWVDLNWDININGRYVWNYNGHTYYSEGNTQLEFIRND